MPQCLEKLAVIDNSVFFLKVTVFLKETSLFSSSFMDEKYNPKNFHRSNSLDYLLKKRAYMVNVFNLNSL